MNFEPNRSPNGVNTSPAGNSRSHPLFMLPREDPTRLTTYFNDFTSYAAGDWTITDVGTDTRALTDGDGGVLLLTTGAAGTDSTYLQLPKLMFYPETGKQIWFEARIQPDNATLSNIVVGLQSQDTTPLAVADGLYFIKASGAATIDFKLLASSAAQTASAIASVAAATWVKLAFYYDGESRVTYYVDSVALGTIDVTTLPTAGLTVSFGLAASTAVARTLRVDYLFACKERVVPYNL